MRTKPLLCGCIILLVMVVATATPCFADTVIHGCVRALTGILRIVGPSGQCLPGETPISWNQTGPQGPQGQQGPKGDTGPAGPAGSAGVTAVFGWIRSDGVPVLGDGFTSLYDDPSKTYYITFNQAFAGDPGCTISLLSTPTPTAFCSIIGVGPSILDVECVSYGISAGGTLVYQSNQAEFAFVCVGNVN